MLKRHTPLKRGGYIRRRSPDRRSADAQYRRDSAAYLAEHPFCQIYIFRHKLDERFVIAMGGRVNIQEEQGGRRSVIVPRSTSVHHRNKRWNDHRKLDQRWWMAVCNEEHEWVENHKNLARECGLLLPIQANEDGQWGDGNQALETPEFMKARAGR